MFCKYCGKQVPDGQVCSCQANAAPAYQQPPVQQPVYQQPPVQQPVYQQPPVQQPVYQQPPMQQPVYQQPAYQQPAPARPAGPDIGKVIGGAFKGIPAAGKSLLGNTFGAGIDLPSAVIFAVASLLLHIFGWMCVVGGLIGSLKDAVGTMVGLGGASALAEMNQMLKIIFKGVYGTAMWAGCLSYLIPLIIGFAIPCIGQLIRKEKVDLVHNGICAATAAVVPAALFFVGGLLSLLAFGLGAVVMFVAAMAGIVVAYKLIAKQMKNTTSLVNGLIIAAILTVIVALVAWIVSGAFVGFVENGLMKNLAKIGADIGDLGDIFEFFM